MAVFVSPRRIILSKPTRRFSLPLCTVVLMRYCLFILFLASLFPLNHQALAQPTPSELLAPFSWRNIGPANMMGRISAVDGYDKDFRVLLVGAASGGVWKTTNAGTTWEPIFDEYGSQSIGDVTFFQPDTSIIWVGTGEATNRNSVGWGDGIYKSTDGGRTFLHMGLKETYQISEIATHPSDPDIVYVAAIGHLFDYSGDRGLYKTMDGGETWTKLTNGLPTSPRVGATVVAIDPKNPDIIYAGMYDRLRKPYNMQSGGPEGGLFKSTDAGTTWTKLTNGLPTGETGQIDIDIFLDNPNTLVAYVEADENLPANVPGGGIYRSDDAGATWTFQLKHFSRPTYHGRIRIDPYNSDRIYVVSRDFQYSNDGGETFIQGQPWSVDGGDDHDLWISPQDPNGNVILMATDQGARLTLDGGASAFMFNNMAIGQYYAIGVDMRDPYWVYGGLQDNGGWALPSNSKDPRGILTDHVTVVNGGDGFHMQIDPTNWRNVYTTTHVGFFGHIDMLTREKRIITPNPSTVVNFDEVYDPSFGERPVDYTINPGDHWTFFDVPSQTINGASLPPQFRFNWNAPLVMSPTNPNTLYAGGSHLFKTIDQGHTWRIISPDLTRNHPQTRNPSDSGGLTKDVTGAENHHTIYTIDESAIDPAIVWVGTDDGLVQVTRNGGASWTNVTPNIPSISDSLWVSRVEASQHEPHTAYVTFDGHWVGDTAPYVYKTTDLGATWTNLSATIPSDTPGNSVYTIVEDPVNPNLLFIGTEFGCFVSLDQGATWHPFMNGLPPVAIHDLVIHPRDMDLIAGTHGRSIWIADDLSALQQFTPAVQAKQAHVFEMQPGTRWANFNKGRIQTHFKFRGQNPPRGAAISFYLNDTPRDSMATLLIADLLTGKQYSMEAAATAGINTAYWPMVFSLAASEVSRHRRELAAIADTIEDALVNTQDTNTLFHMARDLRAPHRAPSLMKDETYRALANDRALLIEHLSFVRNQLNEASNARALDRVRSALLSFSNVLGDEVYMGMYGTPLRPHQVNPGTYIVTLTAGSRRVQGTVEVRDDPLLDE